MRNLLNKFIKLSFQDGQAAIIVALAMTALIGMTAFVIDTGSVYEARRSYQKIADAAALAGAQELPGDAGEAVNVAVGYAAMHGLNLSSGDIILSATYVSNDTITVTVSNPGKKLYFGGIFGKNDIPVGAYAKALVGTPAEFIGVVPWGVPETEWVPGGTYTLKCGPKGQDGTAESGNFQALAIGGTGANNYEDNCANGADVPLSVGDWVDTEPGNMKGPTLDGVERRIEDHPDYTFNTFENLTSFSNGSYSLSKNDSQFVICPVIPELPSGRDEVQIVKFVPFIITGTSGSEVYGRFLNTALIQTSGAVAGVDDSGIKVVRLIK
jgi:hypothetical protein